MLYLNIYILNIQRMPGSNMTQEYNYISWEIRTKSYCQGPNCDNLALVRF